MKKLLLVAFMVVCGLAATTVTMAGANLPGGAFPHTEPIDGSNTFPPTSHLPEDPFGSPVLGGSTEHSDLWNESCATHWTWNNSHKAWVKETLPEGHTMDIRELWLTWDTSNVYIGVQGPNSLWDAGDLFIALDVAEGGTYMAPWNKTVDFDGWLIDYFISVERPLSDPAGYAVLTDSTFFDIKTFTNGIDGADSGWRSANDGGMFYEFALSWADLGVTPGTAQNLRLSV